MKELKRLLLCRFFHFLGKQINKRKENAIYPPLPLFLVNYRFFQVLFWSWLNAKWRCVLEFVTDIATVTLFVIGCV